MLGTNPSNTNHNDTLLKKLNYSKLKNLVYVTDSVDNAVDTFIDLIENAIFNSTKYIKIKNNKTQKQRKAWMSKGLMISCKNKNKLYYYSKKYPNDISKKNKIYSLQKLTHNSFEKSSRKLL